MELRIVSDQRGGRIRGKTMPNARIEASNLSTLPSCRLHAADAELLGCADASGRFSLPFVMRSGDLVQVRARGEHGRASSWVTFRARGIPPKRPHGPALALCRIGLVAVEKGLVRVFSTNPSRPITEPGAGVVFENMRSAERSTLAVGLKGNFARGSTIPGVAGDRFRCWIEGAKRLPRGTILVPRATPASLGLCPEVVPRLCDRYAFDDAPPVFTVKKLRGVLHAGRVEPADVRQGQVSDCYLAAAAAAVAFARPQALLRLIRKRPDGAGFTFHARRGAGYARVRVRVTSDVYARACGEPLYGSSPARRDGRTATWWPLLEKAYAAWKGSYREIDRGGCADNAMEAILGRPRRQRSVRGAAHDRLFSELVAWLAEDRPIVASTAGKESALRYRGSGVFPDHCYAVVGCRGRGNRRVVELFNPWGAHAHHDQGRRATAFLAISLESFCRLFEHVVSVL